MTQGDGKARERRKVFVVLPVFDEERKIGHVLDHVDQALTDAAVPYQVILVDDGSRDGTMSIVRERALLMPILIRQHDANLGLGATLRDGLVAAAALATFRDVVVTMDADDTHTPGLILRMVRMISEGHDVVIASRYQPGSRAVGVPLSRRCLSRAASWTFRIVFPTRGVKDFTCGYRAYRAQVLQEAIGRYGREFADQDGFECMVDILLKLRRMSLIFGEVPFILRYDYKRGGTKMRVGRTVRDTLRLIVRRKLGR